MNRSREEKRRGKEHYIVSFAFARVSVSVVEEKRREEKRRDASLALALARAVESVSAFRRAWRGGDERSWGEIERASGS